MQIIAIVESDDCGPAAVLDSDFISIMKCDGFYLGATRCVFRGTPITCELSEEDAELVDFAFVWSSRFNYQFSEMSTYKEMQSNGDLSLIYNVDLRNQLVNFQDYLGHHKPASDSDGNGSGITFPQKLPTIKQATQILVEEALKRADGNQTIAAKMLGISQQALSKRLKKANR